MRDARGSLTSTWMRLVGRVGVFFFFFLDEDGAERERDVVQAESRRPEKRDGAGRRGMSESDSESESSYCEWDEEGVPFVRRNSVKYFVRVVTIFFYFKNHIYKVSYINYCIGHLSANI